eukprot:3678034-Rhodomonas_salina.2
MRERMRQVMVENLFKQNAELKEKVASAAYMCRHACCAMRGADRARGAGRWPRRPSASASKGSRCAMLRRSTRRLPISSVAAKARSTCLGTSCLCL